MRVMADTHASTTAAAANRGRRHRAMNANGSSPRELKPARRSPLAGSMWISIPDSVAACPLPLVSHSRRTWPLALLIIVAVTKAHGFIKHWKNLVPHGLAWPIYILLIPIEIISYLSRPISLSVRLFANMIMLGVLTRIAGLDFPAMKAAMLEVIPRFHEQNLRALDIGYTLPVPAPYWR